jgi:hypothetical protein
MIYAAHNGNCGHCVRTSTRQSAPRMDTISASYECPPCVMHWMICGIDGEVIDPAMRPADWATSLCGGPGKNTTESTSPIRSVAKTVRSTEFRLVVSTMLQWSGTEPPPPLPLLPVPPPPPPLDFGAGLGSGRHVPPPPLPDIVHLRHAQRPPVSVIIAPIEFGSAHRHKADPETAAWFHCRLKYYLVTKHVNSSGRQVCRPLLLPSSG